jgi:hypothetical protein
MGHGKDITERAQKIKDRAFRDAVVGRCSGLSYTYRDYVPKHTGVTPIEGPAVGDRAPDADLGGGRALFDFTRHTHFTLLLLEASADRQPARAELLRHVTKRFHGLVEAHVVPPSPALAAHYGTDTRDRLYLLRPDGYVGFRCHASEAEHLEAHLAEMLTV